MPNLIGNLLFEHLDKFQAYSSSVCKKVEFQFLKRNFANKMGILQFKRLFHDQSDLSVIVIQVQLCSLKLNVLGTRNSLKKEDW